MALSAMDVEWERLVAIMALLMLDVHVVGSTIFSLSYRSMFFTGRHSISDFSSNNHNLSFLLFYF